jgi:hypothetical protein
MTLHTQDGSADGSRSAAITLSLLISAGFEAQVRHLHPRQITNVWTLIPHGVANALSKGREASTNMLSVYLSARAVTIVFVASHL